jgi:hypothetical protein
LKRKRGKPTLGRENRGKRKNGKEKYRTGKEEEKTGER